MRWLGVFLVVSGLVTVPAISLAQMQITFPVSQTGLDVGFSVEHSFQIQVVTELFGPFQTNNVGTFSDATTISGVIDADLDIPNSIFLSSIALNSDAPLTSVGSSGSVIIDEIAIDLVISVPAGLDSVLIETDPITWLYGGNYEMVGRLEIRLTMSIPSVSFYSTPFEVGPFVFENTDLKNFSGLVEQDSGVTTLILQITGSKIQTFNATTSVTSGLPAGINQIWIAHCCGDADTFRVDWANDFEVIGVPEPSRWLLLAAGLGCVAVLYRVRGSRLD